MKTVFVHTYSSVSETESLERKALLQWQSRILLFGVVWPTTKICLTASCSSVLRVLKLCLIHGTCETRPVLQLFWLLHLIVGYGSFWKSLGLLKKSFQGILTIEKCRCPSAISGIEPCRFHALHSDNLSLHAVPQNHCNI